MTLLQDLHAEHKARRARLWSPRRVEQEPPPEACEALSAIEPLPATEAPKPTVDQQIYEVRTRVANGPPPIKAGDIIVAVAKFYVITVNDLISERRGKNLVRYRHVSMYLIKLLTRQSLPAIGRIHGDRDHTTALHGTGKIERLRQSDVRLQDEINIILSGLAERFTLPPGVV